MPPQNHCYTHTEKTLACDDVAICIASGPSVTQADIDYCRGKGKVYVVNEMIFQVPWAHALYAADKSWWDAYRGCPQYQGQKYAPCTQAANKWGLTLIDLEFNKLWGSPGKIASGGNSGFQVLNLAVLFGAKKVVLLGYDMGHAPDQPKHCFDIENPPKIVRDSNYKKWVEHFEKAAPLIPVPVYNTSMQSNLDCFEKVNLRDIL